MAKECGNCLKSIPEANAELHFVHCLRFLARCGRCGDMIRNADKENHVAFHRSTKQCEDCRAEVKLDAFDVHSTECPKRKRHCCFCEAALPWDVLYEHEAECGARTERCEVCCRYVLRRYLSVHLSECEPLKRKSTADNDPRKRIKKGSQVALRARE